MPALAFTINGIDRTSFFLVDGFSLDWLLENIGSWSGTIHDPANTFKPVIGNELGIYDNTGTQIWGGTFDSITERVFDVGANDVRYDFTAVTFAKRLSKRYIPAAAYFGKSAGQIVLDIFANIILGEGIDTSNVNALAGSTICGFTADSTTSLLTSNAGPWPAAIGNNVLVEVVQLFLNSPPPSPLMMGVNYYIVNKTPNTLQLALTPGGVPITLTDDGSAANNIITRVPHIVFDYTLVTDALDELARQVNCVWWIDETAKLHFVPRSADTAPFGITDANVGTYVNTLSVTTTRSEGPYRNREYRRVSNAAFAPDIDTFTGDGVSREWTLTGIPSTIDSMELNDADVPYGIINSETGKSFYWQPGSKTIVQDRSGTVLYNAETQIAYTNSGNSKLTISGNNIGNNTPFTLQESTLGNSPPAPLITGKVYYSCQSSSTDIEADLLPSTSSWAGTVTTPAGGSTITWTSGDQFDTVYWKDHIIDINGTNYTISSVTNPTTLVISGTTTAQTNVPYTVHGGQGITLTNVGTGSNHKLTIGFADRLKVTYRTLGGNVVTADDFGEQATRAIAENGSGIYEFLVDDSGNTDAKGALLKAQADIITYGRIPKVIEYTTETPGIKPGQLQSIVLSKHGLNGSFLVDTVRCSYGNQDTLIYTVRTIDGTKVETWIDYFSKLANQGANGTEGSTGNASGARVTNVTNVVNSGDSGVDPPQSVLVAPRGTLYQQTNATGLDDGLWFNADGTKDGWNKRNEFPDTAVLKAYKDKSGPLRLIDSIGTVGIGTINIGVLADPAFPEVAGNGLSGDSSTPLLVAWSGTNLIDDPNDTQGRLVGAELKIKDALDLADKITALDDRSTTLENDTKLALGEGKDRIDAAEQKIVDLVGLPAALSDLTDLVAANQTENISTLTDHTDRLVKAEHELVDLVGVPDNLTVLTDRVSVSELNIEPLMVLPEKLTTLETETVQNLADAQTVNAQNLAAAQAVNAQDLATAQAANAQDLAAAQAANAQNLAVAIAAEDAIVTQVRSDLTAETAVVNDVKTRVTTLEGLKFAPAR